MIENDKELKFSVKNDLVLVKVIQVKMLTCFKDLKPFPCRFEMKHIRSKLEMK